MSNGDRIAAFYDPEIDLLRIELPQPDPSSVPAETERLSPDVLIDVEKDGTPRVLEVQRASEHYPRSWLRRIPNAPDEPSRPQPRGPHSFRALPIR